MQRILKHFFEDILNAAARIEQFVADMEYDDFASDRKTIRAVERELEILGEAVKHIPQSIRQQYPDVPWRLAAGMRDRLIHHYWETEAAVLWQTVQESVPQLHTMIQHVAQAEEVKQQEAQGAENGD